MSGLVDEHLAAHFLAAVALALFYWLFTAVFGWALPLAMLRVMIFAGGTRGVETGSSPSLSEELVWSTDSRQLRSDSESMNWTRLTPNSSCSSTEEYLRTRVRRASRPSIVSRGSSPSWWRSRVFNSSCRLLLCAQVRLSSESTKAIGVFTPSMS